MKCNFCNREGNSPCWDVLEASFCGNNMMNKFLYDGEPVGESIKEDFAIVDDEFKIIAADWTDHPDGSATVSIEMSKNVVQFFAQQGLLYAITGAAKDVLENSEDSKN